MRQKLILILTMCAFTAAMVPRERRAVDKNIICAPQTPCAWTLLKSEMKIFQEFVQNAYCSCATGTVCAIVEEDTTAYAYVHKCIPPSQVVAYSY